MKTTEPPLQRIWAQHAELHRKVNALAAWRVETPRASLAHARDLLHEIARVLPQHFALEEQGGYFADVLRAAPEFSERVAELRSHHAVLSSMLMELLEDLAQAADEAEEPALRARIGAFADALDRHEGGENAVVREAFGRAAQGPSRSPQV